MREHFDDRYWLHEHPGVHAPDLRPARPIISESGRITNTEAVSTTREKLQDKLVPDGRRSPILNGDNATRFRSACMRLSYLAQDRLDLAEKAKHVAQRMGGEPREFDVVPLKRATRRQKHVDKITVFVDSDFAGDAVSREEHVGIGGSDWKPSGSTLQSLTATSVGKAEFCAVVKGGRVGFSLRSTYQDLGIPMKIEVECDSSIAIFLLDRWRAGQRTKHIDTRYFLMRERVPEDAHSEELRRCWNEAGLCFSTTTTVQVCRIGILLIMDPTLRFKMTVTSR